MNNKSTHFWCPNCFRRFPKDFETKTLTSNISIAGEGINWSGNLEKDIHKAKRVMYCARCGKPLDYHALLRGRLDYKAFAQWAILIFFGGLIYLWRYRGFSFWAAAGISLAGSLIIGYLLNELEKKMATRWKFSEEQVQELRIKELQEEREKLYEK